VLIQPDLIVRDVLVDLFTSVHEDPSRLQEVFGDRPAAEREEIQAFFTANLIPVDLGFKREQPALPSVFVILGGSQEITAQVPLGETASIEDLGSSLEAPIHEHIGSFFRSTVRIGLLSENANLAVWLGTIVLWGLLQARLLMSERGLKEPQLAAQDLMLDSQWEPAYVFRRDISLQATHLSTVLSIFPKLRGVAVAATYYGDPKTYTASLRR
jgi:hypothetical protein